MTLLTEEFFARATVDVARDLLGAIIRVCGKDGRLTSGRIVETEAYEGEDDPASHAGRGRTPRSEIMFGHPGHTYVYLIYGVHHCLNFVTEVKGTPGAVLIRALEPLEGQTLMAQRRGLDPAQYHQKDLCTGPGKLCQSLGIDLTWNALPLTPDQQPKPASARHITLEAPATPVTWQATPRIGITRAKTRPLRFTNPTSPHLSR